jgi:phospholipid/cholesterol/gamma-HCH transport system substrate-binding protein
VKLRSVLVKLGLFTVFTLAVTVILASTIGNFTFFRARYGIEAAFSDATGVLAGDPVTLAGVRIGKVSGARVEHGVAILKLSLDREVKLPRSSRIVIRYRNLLGLRVVNIDPGTGAPPYLAAGERVPESQTEGPLDLDAIFNNLKPLLTGVNGSDINALSQALVESIGPHKADIDAILANSSTLLGRLSGKDKQIGDLVDNLGTLANAVADQRTQLAQLLSNFATLSDTVAGDSSTLDHVLVDLDSATGQLGRLVQKNHVSLARDLDSVATLLEIVRKHEADLAQIAGHLDDVQRATLKAMSFGEWVNLYIPAFCLSTSPGCANAQTTSSSSGLGTIYSQAVDQP